MVTRITMTMLMTVVVDYWMMKMIIMMIMTKTMATVCFFCQSNCVQNPCQNNATCQSGFTKKGYRCLCTAGFEGPICERGKHNYYVDIVRLSG